MGKRGVGTKKKKPKNRCWCEGVQGGRRREEGGVGVVGLGSG